MFTEIEKRDGTIVIFEAEKITNAVTKLERQQGSLMRRLLKCLPSRF